MDNESPRKNALTLEAALELVNLLCRDADCHGDHDPRHRPRALSVITLAETAREGGDENAAARELLNIADGNTSGAGPLELADGRQWLEVRCERCGRIGRSSTLLHEANPIHQVEIEAAEKLQKAHSNDHRGHRVNVELYFRECVSTRINETPPELDEQIKGSWPVSLDERD